MDGASLEVNFLDSMDLYAPAGKSPVHGSDRYLSCVRKHPEKPVRLNKPPDTTNLRNLYDQLKSWRGEPLARPTASDWTGMMPFFRPTPEGARCILTGRL